MKIILHFIKKFNNKMIINNTVITYFVVFFFYVGVAYPTNSIFVGRHYKKIGKH